VPVPAVHLHGTVEFGDVRHSSRRRFEFESGLGPTRGERFADGLLHLESFFFFFFFFLFFLVLSGMFAWRCLHGVVELEV
jgi:hypothetical protein